MFELRAGMLMNAGAGGGDPVREEVACGLEWRFKLCHAVLWPINQGICI